MGTRFGPARVQYGDWRGTVSLDDPDNERNLYRIAGVDGDRWRICGLNIGGGAGVGLCASVLAVERTDIHRFEDWARLAAGYQDAVPVTEFELAEGTALGLLTCFKRVNVRPTLRHAIEEDPRVELEVVETVGGDEAL